MWRILSHFQRAALEKDFCKQALQDSARWTKSIAMVREKFASYSKCFVSNIILFS